MDGLTATRVIRQLPNGKQAPVMALSANALVEDRAACLNAGMDDCAGKPIAPATVRTDLAEHAGRNWLAGRLWRRYAVSVIGSEQTHNDSYSS